MAERKNVERVVKLRDVRCSFPRLFKAEKFDDAAAVAYYSCALLIAKKTPAHKLLVTALKEVTDEMWPKGLPKRLDYCVRDGEEKLRPDGTYPDGFSDDMVFVNAKNSIRPGLFGPDGSALIEDDGTLYAGCYIAANIRLWAQDHPRYGAKVNCALDGVRFMRHGDRFGGARASTPDDFDDVEDENSDDLLA